MRAEFSATKSRNLRPVGPCSSFRNKLYSSRLRPFLAAAWRHVRPWSSKSPVTIFRAATWQTRWKVLVSAICRSVLLIAFGSDVCPTCRIICLANSIKLRRKASSILRFGSHRCCIRPRPFYHLSEGDTLGASCSDSLFFGSLCPSAPPNSPAIPFIPSFGF